MKTSIHNLMNEIIIEYLKPQIITVPTTFLSTNNLMIEINMIYIVFSLKFDAFQVIKKNQFRRNN
jgi:hypothetical protein